MSEEEYFEESRPNKSIIKVTERVPGGGLYTEEARQRRIDYLFERTGITLTEVARMGFSADQVRNNCESLVGSVEIPLGVAGPLIVNGQNARGLYYAPLATSEGALIASIARGAKVISMAGGVNAAFLGKRMIRAPLFEFKTMTEALLFTRIVKESFVELKSLAESSSRHAVLCSIEPQVSGRTVHVQFVYETGDAAGQNMTTTCTWNAVQWLQKKIAEKHDIHPTAYVIEANFSSDKKVTYQSYIQGRGSRVVADCLLPSSMVRRFLKVTSPQLARGYRHLASGALSAGMVGMNINVANAVAAIFTATGQDIASVHESSIGQLFVELNEDDSIYAALILPSLLIGTVGGGTGLPQQHECLQLMGCAGPGKSAAFAEVIAGFCLALELSTLSALAADEFANAHERLGRNRPRT
ncbi:hydroxymethylglutaryl-CoA reductase [Pseudomonas sp. A34-9]|uniref:hydroxymethylglutaryl-CoA reductase n=1 Tax=Pseudomonas sp. A34-9 TaxID=3034675 RepID=UPI00240CE7FA|nr:hydroxymethylglutaryl-CoA reductase [Pseudomonas sp. A34-9]